MTTLNTDLVLGAKARDTISGWEGTIEAIHWYLNGCVRATIAASKDGEPKAFVFDGEQIEILSEPLTEAEANRWSARQRGQVTTLTAHGGRLNSCPLWGVSGRRTHSPERERMKRIFVSAAVAVLMIISAVAYAGHSFNDVPNTDTFHDDIEWAFANDVWL